MRDRKRPVLSALLVCVTPPTFAQSASDGVFTGSASIGLRNVDLSGPETKFKEDINLDDGVRLFGVNLRYEPASTADARVDRLELDAMGLGGDPFETIHLGVRKYGAYDLRLDRRRSRYFYEDTGRRPARCRPPSPRGRLAYRRDRLDLSTGHTSIDAARGVDQLVVAGTRADLFRIVYESDAALTDFSARWRVNPRLAVGGELRAYDNRGSFRLSRDDLRVFLEAAVGSDYVLQVTYRDIGYAEDA